MAQGFKSKSGGIQRKKAAPNSRKALKAVARKKAVKKGNPMKLPKANNMWRNDAIDDRNLSKAIAKASEQKVAAKLIQDGAKLTMTDLKAKGKELNRQQRRDQLKKKVTRVDEKIAKIVEKQER